MLRKMLGWAAVCMLACSGGNSLPAAEPSIIATSRTQFAIPFRFDEAQLNHLQAQKVHLFVSRDQGTSWHSAQTQPLTETEFQYRPEAEGSYWFSVAVSSLNGSLHPDPKLNQAGLKVLVDRTAPQFELEIQETVADQVQLSWQANDPHLQLETLQLEFRNSESDDWKTVYITPQATGQTSWKMQPGQRPEVRGRISDRAGNLSEQQVRLKHRAASLAESVRGTMPATSDAPPVTEIAKQAQLNLPNQSASPKQLVSPTETLTLTPPQTNQKNVLPQISPAQSLPEIRGLAAGKQNASSGASDSSVTANAAPTSLPNMSADNAPETINSQKTDAVPAYQPAAFAFSPPLTPVQSSDLQPAAPVRVRYMNARDFEIEYQVTGVGPSGVSVVELYITQDAGVQWWRYGVDADLSSPMAVKVPADGRYGFHFRIHSGVGNAEPPPQPGQAPQIEVLVDSSAPRMALLKAYQGHGANINQLTVQWNFADEHPGEKPIAIFYSGNKTGPWQQADGLQPNTGTHTFRLPENAPTRLYLKLQGTDAAGNSTESRSTEPILIDLARPAARVILIDSVRQ